MTILVVAAHPDDEVLGCGGTLARYAAQGVEVVTAFMSDGVTSRRPCTDHAEHIRRRLDAARRAGAVLGVQTQRFLDYPDNQLDTVSLLGLSRDVESLVREFSPSVVVTHFGADLNVDHRLTHEAVMTACRPQPGSPVKRILTFETPSSTEWRTPTSGASVFAPTWFVDIASTLNLKMQALAEYEDELREWPHARSLEGVRSLARWRGATVGCLAAEAFQLARCIS